MTKINITGETIGLMRIACQNGFKENLPTKLINKETGIESTIGDAITSFRGENYILTGWRSPHKPSSSGHVYVSQVDTECTGEFYPEVFGLKFI